MFRKMEESKDYPCHNCQKAKVTGNNHCKWCKEWQDCFRAEWAKMRLDYSKWMRGEKIE